LKDLSFGSAPRMVYAPRDAGHIITIEDSFFLMNVPHFCSEKLDGVGATLAVVTFTSGPAWACFRYGPAVAPILKYCEIDYVGSPFTLDGEMIDGYFMVHGLFSYQEKRFNWYSGMSIIHSLLKTHHPKGSLDFIGFKDWRIPTRVQDLAATVKEGLVFKYAASPTPRFHGQEELGTAKYWKRVPTIDVSYMCINGLTAPSIEFPHGQPPDLAKYSVAECSIDSNGKYVFVRVRPDKIKGNPPTVADKIRRACPIEAISLWISQVPYGKRETIVAEETWKTSLFLGKNLLSRREMFRLATTGVSEIDLIIEGRHVETSLPYLWRQDIMKFVLLGECTFREDELITDHPDDGIFDIIRGSPLRTIDPLMEPGKVYGFFPAEEADDNPLGFL